MKDSMPQALVLPSDCLQIFSPHGHYLAPMLRCKIFKSHYSSLVDSSFIKHSSIDIIDLQKEPMYLSIPNQNLLENIARIQLDLHYGRKNIVLSSFHTGATLSNLKIIKQLARKLDSDLQILDFQSICSIALNSAKSANLVCEDWNLDTKASAFQAGFSPAKFEIEDEEELVDDLDAEEDGVDHSKPNWKKGFVLDAKVLKGSIISIKPTNNLEKQNPSEKDVPNFLFSNFTFNPPREELKKKLHSQKTPYDVSLSDAHIKMFLQHNFDIACTRGSQSLIYYLKDLNDLLEGQNDGTGAKIIQGFVELVAKLRKKGFPALLVVSSSPSLINERNITKDKEFYTQIIDGSLQDIENGKTLDISTDGTIFVTPVDNMADKYEKISLLPPSELYNSLLRNKKIPSTSLQNQTRQYLLNLENNLATRVGQINSNSFLTVCKEQGVELSNSLRRLLSVGVQVKGRRINHKIIEILESLTCKVWSIARIEKVVAIAVGSRLLLQHAKTEKDIQLPDAIVTQIKDTNIETKDPKTIIRIGLRSLIGSLIISFETDISRFSSMPEKDATPSREKEPEISNESTKPIKAHDVESIAYDMKKRGIKLDSYEKRILSTVVNPQNIHVGLSDLILPPSTKQVLQTLVSLPLLRPDYFTQGVLSRSSIHGVCLFGPPGTGKTMLAKAVAHTSGAWFMNISLSDIFDKYVGEGEKNVRAIFTLARKLDGPCVIFLDEVDAVFGSRRSDSGSSRREVLNQFMAEWDGLNSNNTGIVVLGATNRPFDLDDAILRRMPRRILIDLPSEEARKKILVTMLKDEKLDDTVDLDEIAKRTLNYSGSDLKNVCVSAALARVKEAIVLQSDSTDDPQNIISKVEDWHAFIKNQKGKPAPLNPLSRNHLEIGLKECPPSLSEETQSLVELRKWDNNYGDGAANRKGKKAPGIGFDLDNSTS